MARIAAGPLVVDISGKLGSVVIRRTRFGLVAQKNRAPVTFQTAPAIESRHRFAAGVRTWSIMPEPLKLALCDLQSHYGHGSPGPWITAWIAYAMTGLWHYRPVTDAAQSVAILSITDVPPNWVVSFVDTMTPPWDRFWVKLFHPLGDPFAAEAWLRFPNWGSPMSFTKSTVPAGSSMLLVPTITGDLTAFGSGDAHPLP